MAQIVPDGGSPSWLEEIQLCYQRIPSIEEDPDLEVPSANLAIAAGNFSGPFELAIGKDKFWPVGQTLKVSWWSGPGQTGSDALRFRVKQAAKTWDALCNINLDFGNYGENADIRVAFMPGQGSWSYVGKDCHSEKKSMPTMNFGWLSDKSSNEDVRSVVLHEFGHALGCIHEHQNPAGGIKWNEKLVIQTFSGKPNFWSVDKIRHNILDPVATSMNTKFDPDSIMLYAYPKELTLDGKGTHANKELSAMDKEFIRKLYPPQGRNNGHFDTKDIPKPAATPAAAAADKSESPAPGLFNTLQVDFDPPYTSPPKMAIGLTRLDMACKANKAAAATVDHITADSAQVAVSTWDTSVLNGGAATWVEANADDTQWQFGEFNTQELRDRNDTSSQTASKVIYFEQSYMTPPVVLISLKLIDLENHKDYRVKAYATDIHEDHFTIHIDTWGDSILYAGAASWIAYPADLPGTVSASFLSTENTAKSSGRIEFPKDLFVKNPTTRIFLNTIDIKCGTDLRVHVWADNVRESGMDWHADTWADTQMRQAGGFVLGWA